MRLLNLVAPSLGAVLFSGHAVGSSAFSCSSASFTFPDLLGAELQSITASVLQGYTGNIGWKPEASRIGPDGVTACNVTISYTHPGHDDLVSVQLWLPIEDYNGRFVGVGGGGWLAGDAGSYDMMSTMASQGYAAATTNAGYEHSWLSKADSWLMKNPGNLDYPLIVNFAHRAVHDMTIIGRHIVKEAYGGPPNYSYWHGCSTGGRQGLTIANKYPDDYDGILTGCPAVDFPGLLVAMYWPQFVMNQMGRYPHACEFEAITAASVAACDGLDGVQDGIISRHDLCQFDPEIVEGKAIDCEGTPSTVSKDAIAIFKAMLQGPIDPEGNRLFPGITFGTTVVGNVAVANTLCEGTRCTRGLPFTISDDWIRLMVKKDPSFDLTKISHPEYAHIFRESVEEWGGLFGSNNPDLRRFHQLGKKMMTWHSLNDEAITAKAMRQYHERVLAFDEAHDVTTQDYYRYFEIPGAIHCGSPAGVPYPLDALKTLQSWVEEGIAPGELPAVLLGDSSEKQAKRPICVYPQVATLDNDGFVCKPPTEEMNDAQERNRDEL
ncbi:hypothetical protein FZEAL_5258 [Fusarium zealandicum]|uniref:Carboxylic ester hydrolase n=1 Tax=Fusarium zealandicum TaxID=1053134 RepID=A0A8H4UK30_9HYPO|nr:hypothetical protein FZEAL_5258 [Fusarium zealandicum]